MQVLRFLRPFISAGSNCFKNIIRMCASATTLSDQPRESSGWSRARWTLALRRCRCQMKLWPQPVNASFICPAVLGAVVVIYNIKGLRRTLNFTPETLSGIYLGNIKKWNDPQLKKSNPGAALPAADIAVVHRSDGSGTTYVWTDYLSRINPQWKARIGADTTVRWPVGVGAEGNEGVAASVQNTPNSMGYVEFIYAIQHELSFGAVRNAEGEFVKASISSVTAASAATAGTLGADFRVSITNPPGKDSYPIATYTWLLLPESIEDQNKKDLRMELLRWVLTSGQKKCSALGYAPLPADVAKRALDAFGP